LSAAPAEARPNAAVKVSRVVVFTVYFSSAVAACMSGKCSVRRRHGKLSFNVPCGAKSHR
jgi:hypothetical protein